VIQRIAIFLLMLFILLGLGVSEINDRWKSTLTVPAGGLRFTVHRGDTLRAVAQELNDKGIVQHPMLLRLYGRWSGQDATLKQGEYLLPQYLDMASLLSVLSSGNVIQYQVTFPEGITVGEALQLLAQEPSIEHVLDGSNDTRLLEMIAPHQDSEGLFFPDTYQYERGANDWQILQRSFHRMQEVLSQEWSTKAQGLPYKSAYEALIMASIIEKETGQPSERQQIAGVFVRRLQKRMRLQTDPSVIYGLGDTFDGNLRRADLREEANPYNTYRRHGLPPSPIALPGREAIHAALHPDQGDTIYFVARGDGWHEFSSTLKQHQKAVRNYQLKRRSNYRSSPEK
jgi:UPF0755 protein